MLDAKLDESFEGTFKICKAHPVREPSRSVNILRRGILWIEKSPRTGDNCQRPQAASTILRGSWN
jgi:hypothetical protein